MYQRLKKNLLLFLSFDEITSVLKDFFFKFLEDISHFCGPLMPCFGLLVTFALSVFENIFSFNLPLPSLIA